MARTSTSAPSREILEAALQGLESQKQKLDEQIAHVRGLLGGSVSGTGVKRKAGRPPKNAEAPAATSSRSSDGGHAKRVLSAEARKRIAAAQKKRWAAYRKTQ